MRKACISAVCVCLLLAGCLAPCCASAYLIRDLGSCDIVAINDSNQVLLNSGGQAFLWQDGSARFLFDGYAVDVNNSGQVLVGGPVPAIWQDGVMTPLPLPTHPYIPSISVHVYAINDAGQVVGAAWGASMPPQFKMNSAMIWENGGFRPLWSSPYETAAEAYDISDNGFAVGCDGRGHVGGLYDYLMYVLSCAYAVNDQGRVVGSYGYGCPPSDLPVYGAYPDHAFVAQGSEWWDLGTLGGETSCALDINELGQIVGYSALYSGVVHACAWQGIDSLCDLGTLGGTGESRACGINENGWIIGTSNGHAVVWQPIVPEPSALVVLLCAVGGLTFRRRLLRK